MGDIIRQNQLRVDLRYICELIGGRIMEYGYARVSTKEQNEQASRKRIDSLS